MTEYSLGIKPKLFFISNHCIRQAPIHGSVTWFFPEWLRRISLRVIKKSHTPCISFSESKWFYRIQYAHFHSINIRKWGWNKR